MNGPGSYVVYSRPDSRELVRIYCPAAPGTLLCQGMRDRERAKLKQTYGRNVAVWVEDVGEEQYVAFGPVLFGTIVGVLTSLFLSAIHKQPKREV